MSISIRGASASPFQSHADVRENTSDDIEESAHFLHDGALGDPTTEIAMLLVQSFREDRKHALARVDAAEAARLREGAEKVREMRKQADAIRAEGWIRGMTQIGGGGLSVVGATLSIGKPAADAEISMSLFSGGGKAVEGLGTVAGNGQSARAMEHQAEAELHDSRAGAHNAAAEKYRDEADEAERMIGKVMGFLENVSQGRARVEGTASNIRG